VICLDDVSKFYGDVRAVDGVSLHIAPGEFIVLIGASGSGKSTLLKMINRLVAFDRGTITFHGADIRTLQPEALRRRMGYAIQSIGLFPHWTVARNIGAVPRLLGWPAARTAARVDELLALLNLDPATYRGRWPHQLSGGQQQRVGVARALAADPEVLLMDEPFGALDPPGRSALQAEMARIHQTTGKTIVMVTHDIDEALRLATRIVLMDHGGVVQEGTPAQMLDMPASPFVSDFFGREELGLKRLGQHRVADILRANQGAEGAPVPATMNQREALSLMLLRRTERLPVAGDDGRLIGAVLLTDLVRRPDDPES
jgi:osmoprotectant transport system ATP-binding protein